MSGRGIDLWWFRLGGGAEAERAALSFLDAGERRRLRGLAGAEAARFFAFRRAARRVVLAERLGVAPASLILGEAREGKPGLAGPCAGAAFSASHTGTIGVVAVTGGAPVGVDIEAERPLDAARLADRILSPSERHGCEAAGAGARDALVRRAWTGQEALVKAWGTGLDLAAFRRITLDLAAPAGTWQRAALAGDLVERGEWHVCAATLSGARAQGHLVALAAPEPGPVTVRDAGALLARHGLA